MSQSSYYKQGLKEGIHYTVENERVIFTALFHIQRGSCCGNGCRNCAYEPRHKKGTTLVAAKYKNTDNKETNYLLV